MEVKNVEDKDKEIAMNILLKAMDSNFINANGFAGYEAAVDAICLAYKKILESVREDAGEL